MTPLEKHTALVTYLKLKVEEGDWHGVSDAANDLRVMEAAHNLTEVVHAPYCNCLICERNKSS